MKRRVNGTEGPLQEEEGLFSVSAQVQSETQWVAWCFLSMALEVDNQGLFMCFSAIYHGQWFFSS